MAQIYIIDELSKKVIDDAVMRILGLRAGPGILVHNSPSGITISLAPKREYTPQSSVSNRFLARITAVSGSFPAWSYTVQRIIGYDSSQTGAARWVTDGVNITGTLNADEFAPPAGTYPYEYGNGSNITASDGTVDSGSCVIIPIGVGARVWVSTHVDTTGGATVYSFEKPNGAEAA